MTIKRILLTSVTLLAGVIISSSSAQAIETMGDPTFSMDTNYNFASPSALLRNSFDEVVRYVTKSPFTIKYNFTTQMDIINCVFEVNGSYAKNGTLQDLGSDQYECTTSMSASEIDTASNISIVLRYQTDQTSTWYTSSQAVRILYTGFNVYEPVITATDRIPPNMVTTFNYKTYTGTPVLKLELYRSFNDGAYTKIADCDPKPPAYFYEICNSPIPSSDQGGTYSYYLLATDELGRTKRSNIADYELESSDTDTQVITDEQTTINRNYTNTSTTNSADDADKINDPNQGEQDDLIIFDSEEESQNNEPQIVDNSIDMEDQTNSKSIYMYVAIIFSAILFLGALSLTGLFIYQNIKKEKDLSEDQAPKNSNAEKL